MGRENSGERVVKGDVLCPLCEVCEKGGFSGKFPGFRGLISIFFENAMLS